MKSLPFFFFLCAAAPFASAGESNPQAAAPATDKS